MKLSYIKEHIKKKKTKSEINNKFTNGAPYDTTVLVYIHEATKLKSTKLPRHDKTVAVYILEVKKAHSSS